MMRDVADDDDDQVNFARAQPFVLLRVHSRSPRSSPVSHALDVKIDLKYPQASWLVSQSWNCTYSGHTELGKPLGSSMVLSSDVSDSDVHDSHADLASGNL